MDEGSRAALRLSLDAGLVEARRALHAQQRRLGEATEAVNEAARRVAVTRAEQTRWEDAGRALTGREVTAGELRERGRRGEAIEARMALHLDRLDAARAARAAADAGLDEARRAAGEQLARQRWLDDAARVARVEQARQVERREDED